MSNPPLAEKIDSWLAEQGYPLEFRVARTFASWTRDVLQSESFQDPRGGDVREIDVIASLDLNPIQLDDKRQIFVRFEFVIECKSTRKHPWVAFQRAKPLGLSDLALAFPSSKGFVRLFARSLFAPNSPELPLRGQPCAIGVTTALRDKSQVDLAYSAVQAVEAAATARSRLWDEDTAELIDENMAVLALCIPIVVTDAPLFSADLDSQNTLRSSGAKHLLVISRGDGSRSRRLVVVCEERHLPELWAILKGTIDAIETSIKHLPADSAWDAVVRSYEL